MQDFFKSNFLYPTETQLEQINRKQETVGAFKAHRLHFPDYDKPFVNTRKFFL